jgi:hypothetical protein
MNKRDYFPKIFNERIKYCCDDFDSQGLEKGSENFLILPEIVSQLIKTDNDSDEYW